MNQYYEVNKIDSILVGWLRTIYEIVRYLNPLYIRKWYITISLPRLQYFWYYLNYALKRTHYCYKCNILVPIFQLGSSDGSDGQLCAQCNKEIYSDKRKS